MKVNVIEKLQKTRESSMKQADAVVEEVKLLMDTEAEEERRALRVAGLTNHMEHVERHTGQEIERAKFEKEYGNNVFTQAELRDICMKYDLRMLPAKRFQGKIDGEVAVKLKNFMKDRGGEMGSSSDGFYVIAPESAFQLQDQPRKEPRQIDPILVYRTPRRDQYVFIHKWGKDFTFWRRMRGIFFSSLWNMKMISWFMTSLLTTSIVSIVLGGQMNSLEFLWFLLPTIALSFPLSLLIPLIMFNDDKRWERRLTSYTWNDDTKRRY